MVSSFLKRLLAQEDDAFVVEEDAEELKQRPLLVVIELFPPGRPIGFYRLLYTLHEGKR